MASSTFVGALSPAALSISFFALCILYVAYYRFLHPLARFPGPLICSLTNSWKLWAMATDRMPDEIVRLHQQYGPVVRVGPNDLSFDSAAAIGDIYKKGWRKGDLYLGFRTGGAPGLFAIMDEKLHAQRKRMYSLGFAMPYLRTMEPLIDARFAILRQQLDRFAATGQVFDLRHYITYCIVDVLGELAFGGDLGNQLAEDPHKIPPVSAALWGSLVAGQVPWLTGVFTFVRNHAPSQEMRRLFDALQDIITIALKSIRQRTEKDIQRDDLLSILMTAQEEKTGKPSSQKQVLADALTLIIGGTHTTGNTVHMLLANLSRNPQHLKRVVAELDANLPPLSPTQAAYPFQGLEDKLDFVNIAMKESARKDPVGTFNMPRTVPEYGATIAGYHVPGGTQAFANIHALHHSVETWGADHDTYDPDRFYDHRAKDLKEFVIPFSVGKRACVGQNLANINVLKMTTMLLSAYEFEFVNVDEPMVVVCHGDSDLATPLLVRCKMRGEPFKGQTPAGDAQN